MTFTPMQQLDLVEAIERVKLPKENLYEELLKSAKVWIKSHPKREFTAGTLAAEIPMNPAEPRVWGAVIRALALEKLIVKTFRYTQEGRSHRGVAAIWRVV